MEINQVDFIGSFTRESQCPQDNLPEYAFIGRSNVGKSSLINMLCARKNVARVSNKPGKTQTLNFYQIDESWTIADLPGYGYAKISKKTREKWERMIENYLVNRRQLQLAFVLIDLRHNLQKIDLEFVNWLGERHIPFTIIYTKADKVKPSQLEDHKKAIEVELLQYWHSLPESYISSSSNKMGREEILSFIEDLNNKY